MATPPPDDAFRVLIVDREPGTADSECLLLAQLGFECRAAYAVRTAAEQVRSFRPHAVLLDIEMSSRGYQLGEELRRRSPLPRLFLVAVTEHADDRQQMLSLQAGFDSLLVKPVAPDLLCRLLQGMKDRLARGG